MYYIYIFYIYIHRGKRLIQAPENRKYRAETLE